MKLIIAGGGTGGHLFPGIAVAEEFLSRDPGNQVLFVGTKQGIEARAVPAAGYRLETITACGIRGKGIVSQLKGAAMMMYGYAQSRAILKAFRPDLVLGVGGYASLPMVLAAKGMQIPSYIHEQNAIPGHSNRLLAKFSDRVFITLDESAKYFPADKVLLTGNPLRRQILDMIQNPPHPIEKKEGETEQAGRFHIFIFGGSQGAHAINQALVATLPLLQQSGRSFSITHQTGQKDYPEVEAAYRTAGMQATVTPFISNMATEYAAADLIICRAGATTIAEVTACGKACLFIPFPHAVDDHQRKNAEALLKKEACHLLVEPELTPAKLADLIIEAADSPEQVHLMEERAFAMARLDAATIIVDQMVTKAS